MHWDMITALATIVSTGAFVATAIFVAQELKGVEKSRYLQISSDLFSTWQSRDFMEAQLWLIHRLEEKTWSEFVAAHRADYGEQAFHRVGSFYDRVGTLVRLGMIDEKEILSTLGPYAIAVWKKIEPLVVEARGIENSILFDDFEKILPACYECYVPNLKIPDAGVPFTVTGGPRKASVRELRSRLERGEAVTILDVRKSPGEGSDAVRLPGAIMIHPDELAERFAEIPPENEVYAYCA